jgi:two-component system, cell cycle sensor histidine kinase and response regulator CckA
VKYTYTIRMHNNKKNNDLTDVRILVMDDDEVICMVIKEMLELKGADVDSAVNGECALELYKEHMHEGNRYDLVIMDLHVYTGAGGEETMKELHTVDSAVAIIISSGYVDDIDVKEYAKYGVKAVLMKPFTENELTKKIITIIS